MAFKGGKVAIKQIGTCGFDVDGIATGNYQRETSARDFAPPSSSSHDKYVEAVRGGILDAPYNTTEIGKAFEATFTQALWKSAQSDKGVHFVEFTGRLKPEMYKASFDSDDYGCRSSSRREAMRRMNCADQHEVAEYTEMRRKGLSIIGERRPCGEAELSELPALSSSERCPSEEVYSTVTFQFVFDADGKTFRLEYFDPKPWEHTALYSYKASSQTEHCKTFSDGTCSTRWTTTQGGYSADLREILGYIYR